MSGFLRSADTSGCKVQLGVSAAVLSVHTELAVDGDSLARKSSTLRAVGRALRPNVRLCDRRLRWFTSGVPNSLLDGESLYRPKSVMRGVMAWSMRALPEVNLAGRLIWPSQLAYPLAPSTGP